MQGIKRKLLYVTVFEAIAISICTVGFATQSGKSLAHAGALSVAAALTGKAGRGPIVAVVSGGNIDLDKFFELIGSVSVPA